MSTQTGRASIMGFAGSIAAAGVGTLYLNSGDVSDEFNQVDLRDGDNELKGFGANGLKRVMRMQFTPVASSGANHLQDAKASLEPPAPLAQVTLSGFDMQSLNADWSYVGGWRLAFSRDDRPTYELMIAQNPNEDVTGAVAAGP